MGLLSPDSYEEFTQHLQDREYFGQKLGLERITSVLDHLGNPHQKIPSIHIAGTNGKGSTAVMIASILKEEGYRVGFYTSPHLVDFCERVQISREGGTIKQEQVLHYARMIREVEDPNNPLTFFELATAIGFLHFAEEKVDIAVIETGMGGRLDATNVVTPLVSVITTIGLDHTRYLGTTLSQIAAEKAGIIKDDVPVIVGPLEDEALEVVAKVAARRGAPLFPVDSSRLPSDVTLNLAGEHQRLNGALAAAAADLLKEIHDYRIDRSAIARGLASVSWPGRLETVQERPWILLDGAHNTQAMRAVREFLEPRLEGRRLKVIFGAMADKDLNGILAEIAPITDRFIFTTLPLKRGADPKILLEIGRSLELESQAIGYAQEAYRKVSENLEKDDVLLVTGSFYLIGEVKKCSG